MENRYIDGCDSSDRDKFLLAVHENLREDGQSRLRLLIVDDTTGDKVSFSYRSLLPLAKVLLEVVESEMSYGRMFRK